MAPMLLCTVSRYVGCALHIAACALLFVVPSASAGTALRALIPPDQLPDGLLVRPTTVCVEIETLPASTPDTTFTIRCSGGAEIIGECHHGAVCFLIDDAHLRDKTCEVTARTGAQAVRIVGAGWHLSGEGVPSVTQTFVHPNDSLKEASTRASVAVFVPETLGSAPRTRVLQQLEQLHSSIEGCLGVAPVAFGVLVAPHRLVTSPTGSGYELVEAWPLSEDQTLTDFTIAVLAHEVVEITAKHLYPELEDRWVFDGLADRGALCATASFPGARSSLLGTREVASRPAAIVNLLDWKEGDARTTSEHYIAALAVWMEISPRDSDLPSVVRMLATHASPRSRREDAIGRILGINRRALRKRLRASAITSVSEIIDRQRRDYKREANE